MNWKSNKLKILSLAICVVIVLPVFLCGGGESEKDKEAREARGTFVTLPEKRAQTSVWSQSIDTRRIDTTRLTECRENLGVYPVGNGRCFTYLGIGFPQNTLFMMTGPRYQTDGNHNPFGGFGELSLSLHEGETTVDLPLQGCRTVRGAPVVLTDERGTHWKLTTVTAAPPGVTAILRWITVERLILQRNFTHLACSI